MPPVILETSLLRPDANKGSDDDDTAKHLEREGQRAVVPGSFIQEVECGEGNSSANERAFDGSLDGHRAVLPYFFVRESNLEFG
jgi:hypothetical protein